MQTQATDHQPRSNRTGTASEMQTCPAGYRFIALIVIFTALQQTSVPVTVATIDPPQDGQTASLGKVTIERIAPEDVNGQGYRLSYHVDVPIATYWRFKIDFDNDFVTQNKYIRNHRLISRNGAVTITENRYTYGPDVYFRWRTTVFPEKRRLDFVLMNAEQCQQRYHHGFIQMEPEGDGTRVTQVAFFDFWGASFWAHYPWKGGMLDFLTYTAHWEQSTAVRLEHRYRNPPIPKK